MAKGGDARVLFADKAVKVNRDGASQPRVMVPTERHLYTLTPGKWRSTNRVPLADLTGLSMSTFADGFVVVHVKKGGARGPGGAALLMHTHRKAEMAAVLAQEAGIELTCSDTIDYISKKGGLSLGAAGTEPRTLTFAEDAALKGTAALLDEASAKTATLRVRVPPALGSNAAVQLAKN